MLYCSVVYLLMLLCGLAWFCFGCCVALLGFELIVIVLFGSLGLVFLLMIYWLGFCFCGLIDDVAVLFMIELWLLIDLINFTCILFGVVVSICAWFVSCAILCLSA